MGGRPQIGVERRANRASSEQTRGDRRGADRRSAAGELSEDALIPLCAAPPGEKTNKVLAAMREIPYNLQ